MTPRERVEAAFRFEEPDRLPYTIWYEDEPAERLARHYGDGDWARRWTNHILRVTVDWERKTPTGPDTYLDAHGTEWRTGHVLHLVRPALREPSLRGYAFPDYTERLDEAVRPIRAQIEAARADTFIVVGFGIGVFERAWMLRGFEAFFMDLIEGPRFAHELLDAVLAAQLRLLDELVKLPADGIIFSDDFGDQRGVLIGPDRWRTFVKPRVAALYRRVHEAGMFTLQHTCAVPPAGGDGRVRDQAALRGPAAALGRAGHAAAAAARHAGGDPRRGPAPGARTGPGRRIRLHHGQAHPARRAHRERRRPPGGLAGTPRRPARPLRRARSVTPRAIAAGRLHRRGRRRGRRP